LVVKSYGSGIAKSQDLDSVNLWIGKTGNGMLGIHTVPMLPYRRHKKICGIFCAVPKGDGFSVSAQRKADYLKKREKRIIKAITNPLLSSTEKGKNGKN